MKGGAAEPPRLQDRLHGRGSLEGAPRPGRDTRLSRDLGLLHAFMSN